MRKVPRMGEPQKGGVETVEAPQRPPTSGRKSVLGSVSGGFWDGLGLLECFGGFLECFGLF